MYASMLVCSTYVRMNVCMFVCMSVVITSRLTVLKQEIRQILANNIL